MMLRWAEMKTHRGENLGRRERVFRCPSGLLPQHWASQNCMFTITLRTMLKPTLKEHRVLTLRVYIYYWYYYIPYSGNVLV